VHLVIYNHIWSQKVLVYPIIEGLRARMVYPVQGNVHAQSIQ